MAKGYVIEGLNRFDNTDHVKAKLDARAEQQSQTVSENVIYRAEVADESKALVRGVKMAGVLTQGMDKLSPDQRKKIMTLVSLMAVGVMVLSSCGPTSGYETMIPPLTQTTEVRPINTPTKQATASFTPENTATREPTVTPIPPDLPVEFFKQIPGGGYEVRDNGVFAPDATGNMRMWYEKQPDGSFREIYFRYGEPLTEQKKIELANKLVCEKADTCISDGPYADMKLNYFEFISTGIAEKRIVIDPNTGEYKGYLWDMVVVSRDVNNKPVVVRELLEAENFDNPGIDNVFFISKSFFSENSDLDIIANGHKLLGVDAWRDRYLPEGRMRTFLTISGLRLNLEKAAENMLGNYGDSSHLGRAINFITSGGIDADGEIILIWQGDVDRVVK